MREIVRKKQFKKDYQSIKRTGRNMARFVEALGFLQSGEDLPGIYRDHQLTGNWQGYRECHLGGDWLLIFERTEKEIILVRMGSHSELRETPQVEIFVARGSGSYGVGGFKRWQNFWKWVFRVTRDRVKREHFVGPDGMDCEEFGFRPIAKSLCAYRLKSRV